MRRLNFGLEELMAEKTEREMLSSRLGFLLIAAGCAIGLGNVWRFPFITGAYGGAWFLIIFVFCQLAVMPVMLLEFSIGRAARRSFGPALRKLEPKGTHWHWMGCLTLVGSYCLLMFYTTISGWMLVYCWHMLAGTFSGLAPEGVTQFFTQMTASPSTQIIGMSLTVLVGAVVCFWGVQAGIERVVKVLMAGLFLILLVLVIHSLTLSGALEGLKFYLMPDASKIQKTGFLSICSAALNQAFFTLSIGIGCMCAFGSYLNREHSLSGEVVLITCMDFLVALCSGFIIFPACFTFGVEPTSGPGLVFITLPNIFAAMPGGRFWGTLFFVFMNFTALTTVITVYENIICYCMDTYGMPRTRSTVLNGVCLWLLSLPCALGFNVLSSFTPFGKGSSVLDLEDFIISNNLLPLGALMITLFCTLRCGWGWDGFRDEANRGVGMRVHPALRFYLRWILPPVILILFVMGYVDRFGH